MLQRFYNHAIYTYSRQLKKKIAIYFLLQIWCTVSNFIHSLLSLSKNQKLKLVWNTAEEDMLLFSFYLMPSSYFSKSMFQMFFSAFCKQIFRVVEGQHKSKGKGRHTLFCCIKMTFQARWPLPLLLSPSFFYEGQPPNGDLCGKVPFLNYLKPIFPRLFFRNKKMF